MSFMRLKLKSLLQDFNCFVVIFTSFFMIFVFLFFRGFDSAIINQDKFDIPSPPIKNEISIKESLVTSDYTIDSIELRFGTYKRKNEESLITLKLVYSESNSILKKDTILIPTKKLLDNTMSRFEIEPLHCKTGGTLDIVLEPQFIIDNQTVAVWLSNGNTLHDGKLYINGKISNGDLSFRLNHKSSRGEIWRQLQYQIPGRPYFQRLVVYLLQFLVCLFFVIMFFLIYFSCSDVRRN